MNILHFIYDHLRNPWVAGGGAIRAHEIYKRLADRHRITLVCGRYPGAEDYEEGNVSVQFEGTGSNNYSLSTFYYAFRANRFLKEHYMDHDVVIEDFAPWNPLFSYKYGDKTSVILQIQNYLGKESLRKYNVIGIPFYLVEKYYPLKFKDAIIVNDSLAARYRLPRFHTLSNGIVEDLFQEDSAPGDYIGYMGRIDIYQKGLDVLSDAMKGISAKLKIAGDGRDRKRLLGMLGNRGNAEWVGMVKGDEKIEFLGKARCLIVPSRFEGQGIVVLEAAACGKPVIVSDIPELRYAVTAGFGVSFKTGDEKDLAQKITLLLRNEPMRREMGRKGREYARRFTWDRIAKDYEQYLNDVAGNRTGESYGN
jgi:glycosyltransferase involved in cell wall biosynthesis